MRQSLNSGSEICWITADYYLDTDVQIVKYLCKYYRIHWHIILPLNNCRYKQSEISQWKIPNLQITLHVNSYRLRNPMSLTFFFQVLKAINRSSYEVLYLNYTPSPFFTLATVLSLQRKKTIVTAHQGQLAKGFKFKSLYQLAYRFFYSYFPNVNLFSKTETDKFKKTHPTSNVFTIPLSVKDFGNAVVSKNDDQIHFLNFGTIRKNKNIECLIDAACDLYESGQRGFHVTLKGECDNWEYYQQKLRFPEIFTCDIRLIDNDEIAELFNKNHYLVLPYNQVSQSGILKIAFNYNLPVIASDIGGFTSEIEDGVSGYLFKANNVSNLTVTLKKAILNHPYEYSKLKAAQRNHIENNCSQDAIIKMYQNMFKSFTRP